MKPERSIRHSKDFPIFRFSDLRMAIRKRLQAPLVHLRGLGRAAVALFMPRWTGEMLGKQRFLAWGLVCCHLAAVSAFSPARNVGKARLAGPLQANVGFQADPTAAVGPLVILSSLGWLQLRAMKFNALAAQRAEVAEEYRRLRVKALSDEDAAASLKLSLTKLRDLSTEMETVRSVVAGPIKFRFNFPDIPLDIGSDGISMMPTPPSPARPSATVKPPAPSTAAEPQAAAPAPEPQGDPWKNSLTDWVGNEVPQPAKEKPTPTWLKSPWIRNSVLGTIAGVQLLLLALLATDPVGPPMPGGVLDNVLTDLGQKVDRMEESARDRRATESGVRERQRQALEREYQEMIEREKRLQNLE
eukprot:scaffold1376_cov257-Pinguiococcus_pyrenoidosus.AAC.7